MNVQTCAAYRWKAKNLNFFRYLMTFCRKTLPSCRKMRLNIGEKSFFIVTLLEAQVSHLEAQVSQKEVDLCERPDNANLNLLTCAAYRWKAQNPNFFQSVMTFCRKMPPSCRKMRLNIGEKSFFVVRL